MTIAPMCILVKDHSRVLCEQLQQLRTQTGLVDLDIVCEDHHINVHKVVMAACSRFFKDQLCKQNVQAPVILRLEDFGLELKREAVSYIIEFVYRGEVNIPGEKLTEVCAAAHTLGVIGLEHLPVPAETQRPTLINKEHLQIAEESELRRDINNIYNSINNSIAGPSTVATPTSMGKFSMDMNNINPFFMNNNPIQNDDIILLQTANEDNRNDRIDPDIIPISFADHSVIGGGDMSSVGHHQRLYPGASSDVSSGQGEQYRIIPEMLTDGTFAEESMDSCFPSLFPGPGSSEGHDLSPAKAQGHEDHCQPLPKTPVHCNVGLRPHHGKNIANLQHQSPVTHDVAIPMSGGHQTNLAALFEAASSELVLANSVSELTKSSVPASSIVFSTPSITTTPTHCSTPGPNRAAPATPTLPSLQQIKPGGNKNSGSMSQGKLRVINHGIQSENIQSPVCLDKTRRRSGQVSGCQGQRQEPVTVAVVAPTKSLPSPATQISTEESLDSEDSDSLGEDNDSHNHSEGRDLEEIWSGNKSWTHPVESVDTSVPTSGAVWQLPSTEPVLKQQMERSLSLPPVARVVDSIESPSIPWNTPVSTAPSAHASSLATPPPPSVVVSWTQPQSSASPRPSQVVSGQQPPALASSGSHHQMSQPHTGPSDNSEIQAEPEPVAGPSWKNSFTSDDNMLAIRSGIPLALQNKAIRSGVPIGPFQNKRKRKSRLSQEGGDRKVKRKAVSGGKKGDLEVRKDLILDPHDEAPAENVFVNDESCASTSNIVSKTKEESTEVPNVRSPIAGGVHIKTVKKLNSDAESVVAEFDIIPVTDMSKVSGGESSKKDKFQYSCVNCSMMFASAGQLKRHSQTAHNNEEPVYCQLCPATCNGKENFSLHLYKTHGIGEIFRCDECNFESPVKAVYIKHLSEHISEDNSKKQCPKCEKVFKTKTGLNMHLKQHFDESLFSCLMCDFKTPQKLNLVKHCASKHGQDIEGRELTLSIACEFCDFKCIAEHMLKNHVMRKHTQKSAMR